MNEENKESPKLLVFDNLGKRAGYIRKKHVFNDQDVEVGYINNERVLDNNHLLICKWRRTSQVVFVYAPNGGYICEVEGDSIRIRAYIVGHVFYDVEGSEEIKGEEVAAAGCLLLIPLIDKEQLNSLYGRNHPIHRDTKIAESCLEIGCVFFVICLLVFGLIVFYSLNIK